MSGKDSVKYIEKNYSGTLILNWKNKGMRVVQRKPRKIGPYEIPIKLDITLQIPEHRDIVAKGKIEIPPQKVKEMIISNI